MDKLEEILSKEKDSESYLSIIFGNKIFDECFDFNMSEEKYLLFLRFVKNHDKWDLVSKKNIKTFYYLDLKLIGTEDGKLTLEKDVIKNYHDFLDKDDNGIRLMKYDKIDKMDVNIFPGLDKLNDIRKIREIIFKKNNVFIKFMVVNHVNKDITFESIIYTKEKYSKELLKETKNIMDFVKLSNLIKHSVTEIENLDKLSVSIL